jgi:hypothetical protein
MNPDDDWYSWVGSNHRPPDPQSGEDIQKQEPIE